MMIVATPDRSRTQHFEDPLLVPEEEKMRGNVFCNFLLKSPSNSRPIKIGNFCYSKLLTHFTSIFVYFQVTLIQPLSVTKLAVFFGHIPDQQLASVSVTLNTKRCKMADSEVVLWNKNAPETSSTNLKQKNFGQACSLGLRCGTWTYHQG